MKNQLVKCVIRQAALAAGLVLLAAGCSTTGPVSSAGLMAPEYRPEEIPSGVSASDNGLREVFLAWAKPSRNAYRYRVERADTPNGPFRPIGMADPGKCGYVDRGTPDSPLKDSSTYYYRIVSVLKSGGETIPSQVVPSTVAPPPEPPTAVHAEAPASRAVRLAWEKSRTDGEIKYRVERASASEPDNFKPVTETAQTQFLNGGTATSDLKDSTEYVYRVIAVNRVGAESPPALAGKITTLPPPKPPAKLTAVSREIRCVPLAWSASPEADVVRYDIYRSGSKTGPFEKIGSVDGREMTGYLDGGDNPGNLTDDGAYFYRVRAVNAVTAESADSETIAATTREVPPVVEQVAALSNFPRKIPLSWDQSPDTEVIGYEIWRAVGGQEFAQVGHVAGLGTTNFMDDGGSKNPAGLAQLKDGVEYKFKVVAFNLAYVRSSASQTATARTKPLPAAPAGLQTTTNLPRAINVSWRGNAETDVVEYVVEASNKAGSSFSRLAVVPSVLGQASFAAREAGLNDGAIRQYRLKAINHDGLESPWADIIAGQVKPYPDAPAKLIADPVKGGVRLRWEPPPQPDITAYVIWKKTLMSWELIGTTDRPEYVFLNTDLGKTLTISISAIDRDGLESPKSGTVAVSAMPGK